jgi:hypothetical protein
MKDNNIKPPRKTDWKAEVENLKGFAPFSSPSSFSLFAAQYFSHRNGSKNTRC